jgi:hypothetical protein
MNMIIPTTHQPTKNLKTMTNRARALHARKLLAGADIF